MNCYSDKSCSRAKAFSLVEVLMALSILALICSSVLVVIDRGTASAANSALHMRAFEVARENMEALLAAASLKESVEYGQSDKYPDIRWRTVVETFYEPITARMWVRGVCSAQFDDPNGQEQTLELEHWLTDLTKEQLLQLEGRQEEGQDVAAAELIETLEAAAEYAGVEAQIVEQWLANGMQTMEDGSFVKSNLDLYKRTNGSPSDEEKKAQIKSKADLMNKASQSAKQAGSDAKTGGDEVDRQTGLTYKELEKMDFSDVWNLMKNKKKK